jgi:hypothetical protein
VRFLLINGTVTVHPKQCPLIWEAALAQLISSHTGIDNVISHLNGSTVYQLHVLDLVSCVLGTAMDMHYECLRVIPALVSSLQTVVDLTRVSTCCQTFRQHSRFPTLLSDRKRSLEESAAKWRLNMMNYYVLQRVSNGHIRTQGVFDDSELHPQVRLFFLHFAHWLAWAQTGPNPLGLRPDSIWHVALCHSHVLSLTCWPWRDGAEGPCVDDILGAQMLEFYPVLSPDSRWPTTVTIADSRSHRLQQWEDVQRRYPVSLEQT